MRSSSSPRPRLSPTRFIARVMASRRTSSTAPPHASSRCARRPISPCRTVMATVLPRGRRKAWWRREWREGRRGRLLFRPYAGGLHDRRPAPHFLDEERGIILRRPDLRLEAELRHAGGECRRLHGFVGLEIELVNDVGRCTGGREQTG